MSGDETQESESLDPTRLDLGVATIRAVTGTALLLAPGLAVRAIAGADSGRATVKTYARFVGARNLALAVDMIWALDRPADLPRVHKLHAAVDAADAVAVIASPGLSAGARVLGGVVGSAAAVAQSAIGRRWTTHPDVVSARST